MRELHINLHFSRVLHSASTSSEKCGNKISAETYFIRLQWLSHDETLHKASPALDLSQTIRSQYECLVVFYVITLSDFKEEINNKNHPIIFSKNDKANEHL